MSFQCKCKVQAMMIGEYQYWEQPTFLGDWIVLLEGDLKKGYSFHYLIQRQEKILSKLILKTTSMKLLIKISNSQHYRLMVSVAVMLAFWLEMLLICVLDYYNLVITSRKLLRMESRSICLLKKYIRISLEQSKSVFILLILAS